jgi:hypothetical protein
VNALAFVAGAIVVLLSVMGVISVLILPRPPTGVGRASLLVIRAVHLVFDGAARVVTTYEAKDRLLAPIAPVALIVQLLSWAGGLALGFALMLVPTTHSFWWAITQSVTSLLTVGAVHSGGRANSALDIGAGATWVVVVALQIAYLPSLYSKFAHREGAITLLETRAGLPTWGPELLVRHCFLDSLDQLADYYAEWERWAAEVSESHTTYPVLMFFRSPDPWLSWATALLTVLDAAALHMSVSPASVPSEARPLLHTGFRAFNHLAASLGWAVDEPSAETPVEITPGEFAHAVSILREYDFPVERDAAEAWADFRGWRVNYERSAYRLNAYLMAPPAPWSGTRHGVRAEDVEAHRPPHQLLDRVKGGLTEGDHLSRRANRPANPA